MKIEFIDELPGNNSARSRAKELRQFAEVLAENPGKWAKYPTKLAETSLCTRASQLNKGLIASFPAGKFEAAVREQILYVRAVPATTRRRRRS